MIYAFNDDKSKADFKAIKAIYPIGFTANVVPNSYEVFELDSLELPDDTTINNCAVVVSGTCYDSSQTAIPNGDILIGDYFFTRGIDSGGNYCRYPVIRYKATASGRATVTGMVILFE